jgi:hypothetical protein
MGRLIGFPDPVNETSARVVASGVVAMSAATILLDQPVLLAPLTYGFAARVLTGPKLSPLGRLATQVITPRLQVEHRYVPGPPKRLAQGVGLVFTSLASSLVATGRKRAGYRVLSLLLVAAALEAVFGFCLVCKAFPLLMKTGLVPEETCRRCAGGDTESDAGATHKREIARSRSRWRSPSRGLRRLTRSPVPTSGIPMCPCPP